MMMPNETAVTLLRDALDSGQLRDTLIEQRIRPFMAAERDQLAEVALAIGEDLLRWAELVNDDGDPTGTLDEMRELAEILQSSSIPGACSQIRQGMLDAAAVRTFVVRQTEEFRVRATTAEAAVELVADPGDSHPDVEWLSCTGREAEEA
jgi:glycine/D-amino acid oxidase-like deaminating enzyme